MSKHEDEGDIEAFLSGRDDAAEYNRAAESEANVRKLKNHFADPLPGQVEDLGTLEYRELSEELLREYKGVCERTNALLAIRATLRSEILRLAGNDRGMIQRGGYAVTLKERAGSASFDWRAYVRDELGEDAVAEALGVLEGVKRGTLESKYVEVGKPTVLVEVSELKA